MEDSREVSNENNLINLHSVFVENTNALGVLYALMYINEDNPIVNFSRSLYFPTMKELAEIGITMDEISGGTYYVLAYDIEHNGYIQPMGWPSTRNMALIDGPLIQSQLCD